MGHKFAHWLPVSDSGSEPADLPSLRALLHANRAFTPVERLDYGDHGLNAVLERIQAAIGRGDRIALYADYDVDGTMSCVSWIWFLREIGYHNFVHYIPCRFREGYGVNLEAIKHLIAAEGAQLIITMDTGITANEEAAYCRQHGVEFICTDHHKVQTEKMPDCTILNPKLHPEPLYQELCGAGITFVLLRRLGASFALKQDFWNDVLALVGMATICDVVPLNGVNHRLARLGVQALMRSTRPIFRRLRQAAALNHDGDEKDVGFRIGPRINAVGRLEHADKVIEAFIGDDPETLVQYMSTCNDKRKQIQGTIVQQALLAATDYPSDPILFLGGDWHPGVVGIAASKVVEAFWRPTWLFKIDGDICKGSARSLPGFDVTEAMLSAKALFTKFGGHQAAGGFSFPTAAIPAIRARLCAYANAVRAAQPKLWEASISYDCTLPMELLTMDLIEQLDELKPYGNGFREPVFRIDAKIHSSRHYLDKVSQKPKHTALEVAGGGRPEKVIFFNEVLPTLAKGSRCSLLVSASRNTFRGETSLQLIGHDIHY